MKYILAFLMMSNLVYAENLFLKDAYGKKITPVKLPGSIEKRTVKLKDMEVGEKVPVFADAMVIAADGGCWLNPDYISIPINNPDMNIVRCKLGYVVQVNYKYKVVNGYSVPISSSNWRRGYAPPFYIPVKGIHVDKPVYEQASSFRKQSLKMQKDYVPNFKAPSVPANPYSLENQNVQSRFVSPDAKSVAPSPSPDFDRLNELLK